MNYKRDNNKIYLSIDKGEYVNASLLNVCKENNIKFAWINGIGAILDPEVGYFDINEKDYKKKTFKGDFELVSLLGNMTFKDAQPFVHTHITFTDTDYRAYGGHLFDCRIALAGEFLIIIGDEKISRKYNDEIGLSLWNCKT